MTEGVWREQVTVYVFGLYLGFEIETELPPKSILVDERNLFCLTTHVPEVVAVAAVEDMVASILVQ